MLLDPLPIDLLLLSFVAFVPAGPPLREKRDVLPGFSGGQVTLAAGDPAITDATVRADEAKLLDVYLGARTRGGCAPCGTADSDQGWATSRRRLNSAPVLTSTVNTLNVKAWVPEAHIRSR